MNAKPVVEIDVDEARKLTDAGDAVIVDVREPYEWTEARIPGARHVPLGDVPERFGEFPRDTTLVLQCRSGNRSRQAAEFLLAQGFTDVRNMTGGIKAWHEKGHALEAGE